MSEISNRFNEELTQQDINLIKALKYVDNVREFVSRPNEILGSELTKHGEIAEQIDVNINNARYILNGLKERFTTKFFRNAIVMRGKTGKNLNSLLLMWMTMKYLI